MDGNERRNDIDPHRADGNTALAGQLYFLTIPGLVLLFAPAAAPFKWVTIEERARAEDGGDRRWDLEGGWFCP